MRNGLVSVQLFLACLLFSVTAHAQPTLSKVFTPNTVGPGSVSTITFTITNGSGVPVTDLAFADTLPVVPGPMTLADPANASTTCDLGPSGTLSAPDGGGTITLSGAQVGASSSCTITVDVTASTPGVHTNPAVTLSSSAGSSMSLPIDLTVVTTLPSFSKSFAPNAVFLGGRSTLTFTIDNTLNASPVGNLEFTDSFPTGIVIADPPNASTDCISASAPNTEVTAIVGASTVALDADGSTFFPGFEVLAAGGTCTVTVDVVGDGVGTFDNVSDDLLADFTSAGKASDTLVVSVTPLAIRKAFIDDPAPPGGNVTLEFTIDNFDRDNSATALAFTDDLTTLVPPLAGLTFDSLLSNDCGGSVSGIGGTTIGLSGGTLGAEGSCTLRVSLAVPAAATPGTYLNTTSAVTATIGSPVVGNMASDTLFVESTPVLTKEFLEVGTLAPDPVLSPGDDVVLRFTITNPSATSGATDITFDDELTDNGSSLGFLPFPVMVTLPPVPDPPCGAGSSLGFFFPDVDRQGLRLTGGSLAAAPGPGDSCTFDVTVTLPTDLGPAVYTNTTGEITATIDGATRIGDPASDSLTVIAAPRLTKIFDDPVAPGTTVTLDLTLAYPAEASGDATAIAFTDDLAAMGVAGLVATGLPIAQACDPDGPGGNPGTGTLSGSAGDTFLTFMGGTLMPGESCTISVTLTVPIATAPANYTNTTSSVSATVQGLGATSAAASDVLNVSGILFGKEFLGDPVIAGDTLTLRFTIENIHPTDDANITSFADSLTTALTGLAATGPPSVDTCGGALSGTTSLLYLGGVVSSGQTCTIEVEVLVPAGAADGTYVNVTSDLVTDIGNADPANDFLTVNSNLIQLSKAFTDDPVAPGASVTLEFNLLNLDASQAASAIAFTDDLGAALAGLTFDSVLFDDCGGTVGGTGTSMITVSGASLGGGGSCTLRVSLSVPGGATAGVYPNTTSSLTGMIGGFPVTGDPAVDDLDVLQLLDFTKSFDAPTIATGTATLTFTITNPGASAVNNIGFTDDLDAVISGLIAISLPAQPCGASSSITGTSFLTFDGGSVDAMGMCSFDVDVLVPASATLGSFPNVTSELFSAGLEVADAAMADLVIVGAPGFSKAFAPTAVGVGVTSSLTFTIDNTAATTSADSLDFIDNLPAGMTVASPANASVTCTGGTLTAVAGTSVVSYTGGSASSSSTCTISVDVVGDTGGSLMNVSGDLTSSLGNSGPSSATLDVVSVDFSKAFAAGAVMPGDTVQLTFTLFNPNTSTAIGLTFTDDLDAVLSGMVAVGLPMNDVCGMGSMIAGTSVVTFTGGTLDPSTGCMITIDVLVPDDAPLGPVTNLTSPITGTVGGAALGGDPASAASADLEIVGILVTIPTLDGLSLLLLAAWLGFLAVGRLRAGH